MWSWVGLSRDTAESRSAPRVTAVTSSSIRDGVRCVLGRALRRFGCHGRGPQLLRDWRITPPRPVLGRRGYATRVMLKGARAAGIEYKCRGAIQKVRADREVVL